MGVSDLAVPNVAAGAKAGFWVRVAASIIDAILLAVVGSILRAIFGIGAGGGLSTLVGLVYFVYFWAHGGQTIGHKALNLRVIKKDGQPLSVSDAIIRYVGEIISTIVILLGFLWVAWDANKQGWHDKLAHTYVVRV